MKQLLQRLTTSSLLLPVAAMVLTMSLAPVAAASETNQKCEDNKVTVTEGVDCAKGDDQSSFLFGGSGIFSTITNVLLFLIGAISVIMLIIGGIRYVLSNGDSTQLTNAKNTILYAVIGIIVALLAYAIVNFVVTSFTADPSADGGGGGGGGGRS